MFVVVFIACTLLDSHLFFYTKIEFLNVTRMLVNVLIKLYTNILGNKVNVILASDVFILLEDIFV